MNEFNNSYVGIQVSNEYNGTMNDSFVLYIHGFPNCIVLHAKWPHLVERFNNNTKPPLPPMHDFQLFLTLSNIDRI